MYKVFWSWKKLKIGSIAYSSSIPGVLQSTGDYEDAIGIVSEVRRAFFNHAIVYEIRVKKLNPYDINLINIVREAV